MKPGERLQLEIENLQPNSKYEVRISYPATEPMSFTMKLLFEEKLSTRTMRQLLNIEKVCFATNGEGFVVCSSIELNLYFVILFIMND
jgi:hypothetical protein